MKKINLIIIAFISAIIFGCSGDFLDVEQRDALLDDATLVNGDDGAESLVTAIYAKFLDWNLSSFSWIGVSSIITDDADKGSEPGDTGADKDLLDNFTFNASSPSFNDVYRGYYQAIGRANYAIQQLPLITQADPNLRKRLEGEAKCLRAFSYFNMVRMFGSIPLVDHVAVQGNEEDKLMLIERKPVNDIYTFIEKDLTEAIAALPNKSVYPFGERARVSQGTAQALMAKVKLYREQWQSVITYTDQMTGYSLVADYASIFKLEGEFNAESIFEINGYGGDPARGIQQYSQTQGARGSGGWGWGFNTPTSSLVQAYEANDKRKAATIIFAGQTLYDGRVVPATAANPRYNYKAYSSVNSGDSNTDTNIKYLRYSEVLLMRAEAFNELGSTSSAVSELNKVRSRAGLPNTTATTQTTLRIAIWKERRVELAFEHDRWFDLIRTKQALAAFALDGKTFVVGKHELFPIPQSVVDESNGVTTQNPGY